MHERDLENFITLAANPQADLVSLALSICPCEYPDIDLGGYDEYVSFLAARVAPLPVNARRATEALNRELFDVQGFAPAIENYYDPRNSYLNEVIDRREGIPISLCALYISVGRRAGLNVQPVGYPGHFLVKCQAEGKSVYIDVFGRGEVVGPAERSAIRERIFGHDIPELPEHLRICSPREVAQRMLNNLKAAYIAVEDFRRSRMILEMLLALDPDSARDVHDLAVVSLAAGDLAEARKGFESYLTLSPDAADAVDVQRTLGILRQRIARLN